MNFRCLYCGTINSPTELACRQCGGALELGRATHSLTGRLDTQIARNEAESEGLSGADSPSDAVRQAKKLKGDG